MCLGIGLCVLLYPEQRWSWTKAVPVAPLMELITDIQQHNDQSSFGNNDKETDVLAKTPFIPSQGYSNYGSLDRKLLRFIVHEI